MKSVFRLTVRGYELDSFGHVNNAVYLQYAEAAKWDFFENTGLLEKMQAQGLFPVIMESNLRYLHELRIAEKVVIRTDWAYHGGIVEFKHLIQSETTGKKSCKITGKLVFVNQDHIICDIPEAVRICLESEANEADIE